MRVLLIVYDNDAYLHQFPLGLAYIASVLRKQGHEITIYPQDVYHLPESHLTEYLNYRSFDLVGVGVIGGYYQYRKLLKISDVINTSRNRPLYVIGGHGPSPEPDYYLRKTGADAVVIGEGEQTMVELCQAIQNNTSWKEVKGIAFLDKNKQMVRTGSRPLIKDLDTIPYPAWNLFCMENYVLYRFPNIKYNQRGFPVLTSRGCIFNCNFCYRMEKRLRKRGIASIIDEITYLKKKYHITYISFIDELFMSSQARTFELCEAFLKTQLHINWYCSGRLNFASKKVLQLMKRAGCVFVNYGIEAMDNRILKNMNKNLTTEQIIKGVENTSEAGISLGLNIIFGNIGENRETLRKAVDFLLKYADTSQLRTIRPVTPYPGSALYYYAIEKGLLKNCEDFYENKHINSDLLSVNFTELSDEEFHQELEKANEALIKNYYQKKTQETIAIARRLYRQKDRSFRGFR